MDLVDLGRIVARRWYVAVAVLVIGSVAAVLIAGSVAPKYVVEAQSILISGRAAPSAPGTEGPTNPYQAFSGSLFTTLSAVTRTVDGQEYREILDADGAERDFLFTTSQEAPVIITEATAASPDEALELSDDVQSALSETLATLQAAEDVPPDQQIGLRVLTTSNPVQEVGDRNRVLVGILGVTVAGAVGAAVLVESIIAARRRSRSARSDQDPVEGGSPPEEPNAPVAEEQVPGTGDDTDGDQQTPPREVRPPLVGPPTAAGRPRN